MAIRNTKSTKRKTTQAEKRQPPLGCLIWLGLFLLLLLLFIFKWDTIRQTLKDTRFIEAIQSTEKPQDKPAPAEPQNGDGSAPAGQNVPPGSAPATSVQNPQSTTGSGTGSALPPASGALPTGTTAAPGTAPATQPLATQPPPSSTPAPTPTPATPTPATPIEQIRQTRISSLFFVKVDNDGSINRREVKRTIPVSNSPLTDSLQALLKGPSAEELNQNLITLIPSGTRLLSAQVRGSTAYLNFSEEFMYNRYGVEGYAGQLKQLVYTATEFPTVKDVQFLIEGQTREYLGGEGVYIGKPLSRNSF